MNEVQRFNINSAGRDFAVGDIHGHFTRLQEALDTVDFNPLVDRLFSVGDLVDRGPESLDVDAWLLRKTWFHAVRGNHEQMTIDSYQAGRVSDQCAMHFINGGAWFYGLSRVEQACYANLFAELPLVIEVETAGGPVGIVHADVPRGSWSDLIEALAGDDTEAEHVAAMCLWSRRRITNEDHEGVSGIRAVIVGHTVVPRPVVLGNVYYIDTGVCMGGHFTLLELSTLECNPSIKPKRRGNV
ncbi:metallophosphoesterase [Pseudomonas fluorescens]|uniref:Serine/threonine-protein phosphatase 1 n=1 Tax=Pseudomonas fluorescens TaxID=294 RepID=A0A5E7DVA2_PSEFL|nr:metallophosphoesterase [Pseudomonas fluorescens]VVO21437.1 Serine/threonine-protein phosphatase 1 [Pseudomonas fluorescens]